MWEIIYVSCRIQIKIAGIIKCRRTIWEDRRLYFSSDLSRCTSSECVNFFFWMCIFFSECSFKSAIKILDKRRGVYQSTNWLLIEKKRSIEPGIRENRDGGRWKWRSCWRVRRNHYTISLISLLSPVSIEKFSWALDKK